MLTRKYLKLKIEDLEEKNKWLHKKWREASEEAIQYYNELEDYKTRERGIQRIEAYQKVIEKAIDKRPTTKFIKEILLDAKTYNLFREFIGNSVGEDKEDIDREMADAFNTVAGTPLTQIKMVASMMKKLFSSLVQKKKNKNYLKKSKKNKKCSMKQK